MVNCWCCRFSEAGPHFTKLPDGLLQMLSHHLSQCLEKVQTEMEPETVHFAESIIKCLIIISRSVYQTFLCSPLWVIETTLKSVFVIEILYCTELIIWIQIALNFLFIFRNYDNVPLLGSCQFVKYLVSIGTLLTENVSHSYNRKLNQGIKANVHYNVFLNQWVRYHFKVIFVKCSWLKILSKKSRSRTF